MRDILFQGMSTSSIELHKLSGQATLTCTAGNISGPKRESLIFLPTPLHHPLLKKGESPHQIVLPVGKLSLISSFATTLITHFTPVPASSRWRQRQVSLEMLYSLEGVASFNPAVLILLLLYLTSSPIVAYPSLCSRLHIFYGFYGYRIRLIVRVDQDGFITHVSRYGVLSLGYPY